MIDRFNVEGNFSIRGFIETYLLGNGVTMLIYQIGVSLIFETQKVMDEKGKAKKETLSEL